MCCSSAILDVISAKCVHNVMRWSRGGNNLVQHHENYVEFDLPHDLNSKTATQLGQQTFLSKYIFPAC